MMMNEEIAASQFGLGLCARFAFYKKTTNTTSISKSELLLAGCKSFVDAECSNKERGKMSANREIQRKNLSLLIGIH